MQVGSDLQDGVGDLQKTSTSCGEEGAAHQFLYYIQANDLVQRRRTILGLRLQEAVVP